MVTKSGDKLEFWCILGSILYAILTIDAETCHKACTCTANKVTCVGTKNITINETILIDIVSWTPANIIELTIYRAHLPTIPSVFTRFTQLQSLALMRCNITSIAKDAFTPLKTLIKLHISDNPLRNFTADIFKDLTNLEVANFTHNKLETLLQNEFSGLVKLKKLFLNKNKIVKLDVNSFHRDLKNLEILHVNHNNLGAITKDAFTPLLNLKVLDIGWQSLEIDISPGSLAPLKNLKALYMTDLLKNTGDNLIPAGLFSGLDALTILDIRMNYLKTISAEDFEPISKTLKILYVGHNHFENISHGAFHNLTKLETLDMFDCAIEKFDDDIFTNLTSLKYLNLESNRLQNLSVDVLRPVQNASISLRHNLFLCNCAMLDMFNWIHSNNLTFYLTCATPPRLIHKKMYKLTRADLRCKAPSVFSGKAEIIIRFEEHISGALKCHATSYDHYANMSYDILEGNPVPPDQLNKVEEIKWTQTVEGEKLYYTELRIHVKEILEKNAGKISCRAWNNYGNDTGILKLIVYPQRWAVPLWVLILTLVIVFLLVSLCIGCVVYYYKYRSVPISQKFQSPARYSIQKDPAPQNPVSSISNSRTVLHPEYNEPDYHPNYGYGHSGPDYRHDRGEYNVAYLQEAPSIYVTYV